MGVESYLEEHGLSLDLLALGLSLDPEDIVFVTGSFVDGTGDTESDLMIHLLTDERGFERRAPRFAHKRRMARREHPRCGVLYERVGSADLEVRVYLKGTFEELLDWLGSVSPKNGEDIVEGFATLRGLDHETAVE